MTNSKYFNDAPISTPGDDRFGINKFAQTLARNIRDIKSPVGVTVALNGAWGSGKSSAVNLIKHHLENDVRAGKISIVDFKCWWFRGEEALILAFLQELDRALQDGLGKKAKKYIPRIGKSLLQGGAIVEPAINLLTAGVGGSLVKGSMDFAKRYFSEKQSIDDLFNQLSKALEKSKKRYLIIIDDIDRLDPSEAIMVFRLIKSVGRLPNVMYLLVYDRQLAEKAVSEKYPSEGPHFLEKIIQANFELPLPCRDDLNSATLSHIEAICGPIKDADKIRRFMNVYYDAIAPFINYPRDLTRLCNSIAIGWSAIAGEVDLADFVALEVMRLFEPRLYNEIRLNKDSVCGVRSSYGRQEDPEAQVQKILEKVNENDRNRARLMLLRLFPIFEKINYSSEFNAEWESQRLVCTKEHFDTYFRMSIGDETLPISEIDELIKQCDDKEYVKRTFYDALKTVRKNAKSKVPLLLDELNVHASRIENKCFGPLISTLFEIADDINRNEDKERGTLAIGDNNLRIHWLIRKLTLTRCSLDERDQIFTTAIMNAQLGWMVDFVSSAISNHFPRGSKNPEPLEKCLVKKESIDSLKAYTLESIRRAAKAGQLIEQSSLMYILFRWRDLAADGGKEVGQWINARLKEDKSVAILAKACTSETWSQSMGFFGLADRVAIRSPRAAIDGLKTLLDLHQFRERLKAVSKGETVTEKEKEDISIFLDAWTKQEKGLED